MKKRKPGKITCEVPGCDCATTVPLIGEVKKALTRAPWNPPPYDDRPRRGGRSRPRRPAPGDRSVPVAIDADIAPYARRIGSFSKKAIRAADRDFEHFLKARHRNVKKNIGKGGFYRAPDEVLE